MITKFFSSGDQVLIVTKTMYYYLERRQMSHLLNATIIPALSYIFYVRHDEVVHLHEVNTYLIFSFSMHEFRGSLNLNGHRETASVITLQCTHLSLKCVFECVCNLVLIHLHCRRNENILLAEKNMALLRNYCLQTFLQFCTQYFHSIYEEMFIIKS